MKREQSAEYVEALSNLLTKALAAHGFLRDIQHDRAVGGLDWRSWKRDLGWKEDVLEISHPQGDADHVIVHMAVRMKCPGDREVNLDATTVAAFVGRHGRYYFPTVLSSLGLSGPERYTRKVVKDVFESLAWFNKYETPKQSLDVLNSGTTIWGHATGAQAVRTYLQALAEL
jgi:hypothetical protein